MGLNTIFFVTYHDTMMKINDGLVLISLMCCNKSVLKAQIVALHLHSDSEEDKLKLKPTIHPR